MSEFIHFLFLCAKYTHLWDAVFKNSIYPENKDSAQTFDKLYNQLLTTENDLFVYAALYSVYPLRNQDRTLNVIRKAFIMNQPTIVDCRMIPPLETTAPQIHPKQVMYQVTVIGDLSDGTHPVLFRYFQDELSFTPSELIGLTQYEAIDLFHKKDIEYLRG